MEVVSLFLIFISGLIIGSFLGAYTFRLPRGISVVKGRSFCPHCRKKISWFENIPLLSYLILKGKCRNCGKKISLRYPLIEFSVGLLFVYIYHSINLCFSGDNLPLCLWKDSMGLWSLPYHFLVSTILVSVFVIDFENQFIPDELVFLLFLLTLVTTIVVSNDKIWILIFSSFLASLSLLSLNLVTKGRGMGLGDVKLVLFGGLVLGGSYTYIWIVSSFILGGFLGLALLILRKKRFGQRIAFGPFLVVGFFMTLFWGDLISFYLLPATF